MYDFTEETILEAIKGCGGVTKKVARKLGCAWGTAREAIQSTLTTKTAFKLESCKHLEVAIDVVMDVMQNGEEPNALRAAAEVLERRGGEKWRKVKVMDVDVPEDGIVINIIADKDEPEPESDNPQDFVG